MAKIKLTKGELKKQKDALRQYQRYLPTLQLKKQQLQIEILQQLNLLEQKKLTQSANMKSAESWAGLLQDPGINIGKWLKSEKVNAGTKNIAGVDVPFFQGVEFAPVEYDLFVFPLWVDTVVDVLRSLIALREEITVIEKGIQILRQELRITSQRVNLFEKVKIPEAEEAIREIKIFLGDQMANAVGRCKMAKRKIEALEEVLV